LPWDVSLFKRQNQRDFVDAAEAHDADFFPDQVFGLSDIFLSDQTEWKSRALPCQEKLDTAILGE
jgi:hypothetical protein